MTGNREQGPGNREQGTGNREQPTRRKKTAKNLLFGVDKEFLKCYPNLDKEELS
ncbi:MAG: hypothetical protein ACK5QA_18335 [Dolichospermum sp.]